LEINVVRRADILTAAEELFSQSGYHPTSMRDLAKAVNLQGGSLYAHISSKEEVLWEIVTRAADQFLAGAASVSSDLPPAERLAALVAVHLSVIAREIQHATVFFHEWRFLSPERRDAILARRDEYQAYFQRAIEDGLASGAFRVDDPEVATLFVLSALNWTYQWYRPDGRMPLEELTHQYTSLILRALGGSQ
jgi:AcrR family transcriptional regulator